eukprot:scaffold28076_cov52-Cyclotella_meneghiniana.AAC.7
MSLHRRSRRNRHTAFAATQHQQPMQLTNAFHSDTNNKFCCVTTKSVFTCVGRSLSYACKRCRDGADRRKAGAVLPLPQLLPILPGTTTVTVRPQSSHQRPGLGILKTTCCSQGKQIGTDSAIGSEYELYSPFGTEQFRKTYSAPKTILSKTVCLSAEFPGNPGNHSICSSLKSPEYSVDTEIRDFMLLTHYNTRLATIYLLRRDTPWVWLRNLGLAARD